MKIFFSVGEPSGDLHGANLIRALNERHSDLEFVGYGGPRMKEAGCDLHEDLTELAVMWFSRVLLNLRIFWRLLQRAGKYFDEHQPDAVVLIDYPGFNWWIARKARARGIPVFYYGTPQMWAWAPWRARKMRRFVDHVLCKLPFETDWYRQRGCHATYVGHPYFDETSQQKLDTKFIAQVQQQNDPLVTILPGSRTQEVVSQLPAFLRAAALIREAVPHTRFAVASFNEKQAVLARKMIREAGLLIDVHVGRTPELIHAAKCCLACSGSVSLELLYHTKPAVIYYQANPLFAWLARNVIMQVRYITLVNLLACDDRFEIQGRPVYDPDAPGADRVPYPEYPTPRDKSEMLARHVIEWLKEPQALRQRVEQLSELKSRFARPGASVRAAEYLLEHLPAGQSERRAA